MNTKPSGVTYWWLYTLQIILLNPSEPKPLQMVTPMTQNISSEHDDDYDDEYLSDEKVQCHMDRLEWEQARMMVEVGRNCPPFYDRQA